MKLLVWPVRILLILCLLMLPHQTWAEDEKNTLTSHSAQDANTAPYTDDEEDPLNVYREGKSIWKQETEQLTIQRFPVNYNNAMHDPADELSGIYMTMLAANQLVQGMTFQDFLDVLSMMGLRGEVELYHMNYTPRDLQIADEATSLAYAGIYSDEMLVFLCESLYVHVSGSAHELDSVQGFSWSPSIFAAPMPCMGDCAQLLWDREIEAAWLCAITPYQQPPDEPHWFPYRAPKSSISIPLNPLLTPYWWGYPNEGMKSIHSLSADEAFTILEEELIDLDALPSPLPRIFDDIAHLLP